MKKTPLKFIVILALLMFAAYNSWQYYFKSYAQEDTISIHTFPMTIGEWEGEEIPISKNDLAILETDNAFTRRYSTPSGKEIVLFIVYSQTNRKVSHPPEICYSGGGISILSNEVKTVQVPSMEGGLSTHRMFVERGRYQQVANYWFKVGDSYTSNYLKQQALIAIKTFLSKPSSSAMIRVASDVRNQDVAMSDANVRDFIAEILPILPKYLP